MNNTNDAVPAPNDADVSIDDKQGISNATGTNDADVTQEELQLLDEAGQDEGEVANLQAADLDNTDADGELLNEGTEGTDLSGDDLDVPGSEADDTDEAIGEEDEENNSYSLGADKKD